jgi:hypothetical protein
MMTYGRIRDLGLALKRKTTRPPSLNCLPQQARFDAVRLRCPAEVDSASPRADAGLPELAYPFHDSDVLVTACAAHRTRR